MDNSYRIKANIGIDQVLNVNLKQDIDIYEILSLKLKQENLYKLHSADYGVIVGRVLANDAFGVPNAKVTVFIPLSDVDKLRSDIRKLYPYNFVTDVNSKNVKFNTLPNYKKFECHQEVGSFPKKRLVLDEDTILEIYDKYYRYTTITNKAGDYMIFGVPTGEQILHMDVDLSDIGIISQEPRDFIYKGYSPDLFESPTQFKKGTNLDDLPQIQTQNASVTVYPLWGDKNTNEIAITRKDINLQYKFETTCVFLGSVVTDNGSNSISHNCVPDKNVGEAGQLVPSKGNIEMIRKTIDDKIEEYPIKGNQLIDSDGVWCYQIPMNLDYVGMDEYGNIVPTNNPLKGIPTRARVRFRFTLDEIGEDDLTRHKARYLVPNNPDMYEGYTEPHMYEDVLDNDLYYEFGTLTPEDCFRDLFWNKVYSVKNYIPRIQMSKHEKSENYLAIKGVNKKGAMKNNPMPYNKLNLNISIPAYYMLYKYGIGDKGISGFWRFLNTYSIEYNTDNVRESIIEELDGIGLDFYNDWINGCLYFPSWFWHIREKKKYENGESVYDSVFCECKNEDDGNMQSMLYLYNNCSLVYENEDLVIKSLNSKDNKNEYLYWPFHEMYTSIPFGSKQFYSGIIKKKTNSRGKDAFYYTFGNKLSNEKVPGNEAFNNKFPSEIRPSNEKHYYKYARLYSTDIILLGSLKDCDLDGIPKVGYSMPSTTSNIPSIGRFKPQSEEIDETANEQQPSYESDDYEYGTVSHNGMNWGAHWHSIKGVFEQIIYDEIMESIGVPSAYKYHLGSGLFFGLFSSKVYDGRDWAVNGLLMSFGVFADILLMAYHRIDIIPRSDLKTCVNAERISELGVTIDGEINLEYDNIDGTTGYSYVSEMDGLITKREIENVDSRALFATLNNNKLIGTAENYITGYKKYDLKYFYPTNFDGRLGDKIYNFDPSIAEKYTNGVTTDDRNKDYLDFRFGNSKESYNYTYRSLSIGYDGKQLYPEQTGTSGGSVTVEDGEYAKYEIGNGYCKISRFKKPKTRHFYGYKENDDNVYPLSNNEGYFGDLKYTFPLYDNSFYFYFGMNRGSTAIDKLYEKFYSECVRDDEAPFIVELSVTASTVCSTTKGVIRVNVQEISMPYTIQLWDGENLKDEKRDVTKYVNDFTGLANGEYKILVKDHYGNEITENAILKYQKISLDTTVVRNILTEYMGQSCVEICNNNYYGQLKINSYTNYGTTENVSSLNGSNGVYTIGNNIKMQITPNDGGEFSDYVCTCKSEVTGNVINFRKPGTFTIKVYEMCGNIISENVSYYTVTISDTKMLEMYINDVPLKYLVGYDRDTIPYNTPFHGDGHTVSAVDDQTIAGWFGVHNPASYSELFTKPLKNDFNKLIWKLDIGDGGSIDIIREKFNYMFNLSKATYVTENGDNKFVVGLDGGEGELLLRSGMPEYNKFNAYNTEKKNNFQSFVMSENNTVVCNKCNANIVSENYRYVENAITKFPYDGLNVNTEDSIINGSYDFNPKYLNNKNNAANYFAGFSNNANIVQLSDNTCKKNSSYKPNKTIPYKASDLFNDGMCLYSEKHEKNIFSSIYSTYRYFRTEFIDRRFDYNAFYITGHKKIHFDINKYENELDDGIWDKGRISSVTYNGIDMLYDDSNGNKIIISENGNTEYNYNPSTAEITLNLSGAKRFYDSKLYYGDGQYIDLLDAYKYYSNSAPSAFYVDNDGKKECTYGNDCDSVIDDNFNNFGFNGSGVQGYPSKRLLNYIIPYGDKYSFHNVSCSYDGIKIEQSNMSLTAVAVPGEVVDYDIEACELISLQCSDFYVDCENNHYNMKFSGAKTGTCVPCKLVDLPFKINAEGSKGFMTRIENLGVRVCYDTSGHENLIYLKESRCVSNAEKAVGDMTVWKWTGNSEGYFDTSENFKNLIIKTDSVDWDADWSFINMFFDRLYYSQAGDSLMKRIRVFNVSTIYNVSKFGFNYTDHQIVTDETIIPANEIKVETTGDIPSTNNSDETRSNDEGDTIVSEGSNTEDVAVVKEYDYTEFKFTSYFLANCLCDICFKIDYEGDSYIYKFKDSNVGLVSKEGNEMTFGVIWTKHKTLLKKNENDAIITVYVDVKNKIKSNLNEGHMEFAFGFKIKGEDVVIKEDV